MPHRLGTACDRRAMHMRSNVRTAWRNLDSMAHTTWHIYQPPKIYIGLVAVTRADACIGTADQFACTRCRCRLERVATLRIRDAQSWISGRPRQNDSLNYEVPRTFKLPDFSVSRKIWFNCEPEFLRTGKMSASSRKNWFKMEPDFSGTRKIW